MQSHVSGDDIHIVMKDLAYVLDEMNRIRFSYHFDNELYCQVLLQQEK